MGSILGRDKTQQNTFAVWGTSGWNGSYI